MFGLGRATCILCDQRVPRKDTLAIHGFKGYSVCVRCIDRWRSGGGLCPRCQSPLRGAQQAGIFMEGKRGFGHADCGALSLEAA